MDKNILHLTSPVPPSVNCYQQHTIKRVRGKLIVHHYPSNDTKEFYHVFAKEIKEALKEQKWVTPDLDDYVIIEMDIYFKKRGRDADNIFKLILDVLQAQNIVVNDSQFIPRVNNIYIDKDNPRVEMTIYVAEKIGVFKDREELEEFEHGNCKHCTKNKEHCVVYRGLIENRVHDINIDSNEKTCRKKKEYKK